MRNKQLLTDKENERMFADIVENVVKIPIELRYTNKPIANVESYIGSLNKYHVITLGRIKGVDKFTLLNHESGHILFNSPTKSAEDMITKWAVEWKADPFIPVDTLKKLYWYALNLIEDQRIESLMSKLYLNNKKRFYKAKVNVGRDIEEQWTLSDEHGDYPLRVLECVRFFRDDLIDESKYYNEAKKILNEVEGTGQRGALIGLTKFKPFIDKYITKHIGKETPIPEVENMSGGYEEVGRVSISELEETYKLPTKLNFDKLFEDSRKSGEREIEYIKEVLSTVDINKMGSHDVIEGDNEEYSGVGEPIQEIVNDMSKIFKKMNEIPKTTIEYEGDEIDMESYIKNKVEGYDTGKCFIDTRYVEGVSVLVAVDGSNSMEDGAHSSMTRARDMVATMYKAIENVNNINLRTIVWASDLNGKMNVTNIESMEDTRNIRTTREYPTTPTHMAIEYSTKMMKRMKGRKKLLILITDGQPEYMKNYTLLPTPTLIKMCVNAMVKGMRRCDNMVVLLIKPSDHSKKCCEDIFGKRLIVTDDMKSGSDIIMNRFKSLVMGVLS
jgi:hypothetical protein